MANLSSIDLRIADRLRDREFRRHWFRAMLEDNVPEQFRDLREARGLTQIELADAAEMKQSAISRFESQRVANWKLETLLKLADALDAQLEISIIPAEQVIARYQREEAGGSSEPPSVVQARTAGSWRLATWIGVADAADLDIDVMPPDPLAIGGRLATATAGNDSTIVSSRVRSTDEQVPHVG